MKQNLSNETSWKALLMKLTQKKNRFKLSKKVLTNKNKLLLEMLMQLLRAKLKEQMSILLHSRLLRKPKKIWIELVKSLINLKMTNRDFLCRLTENHRELTCKVESANRDPKKHIS